jgi:hypothetical protein
MSLGVPPRCHEFGCFTHLALDGRRELEPWEAHSALIVWVDDGLHVFGEGFHLLYERLAVNGTFGLDVVSVTCHVASLDWKKRLILSTAPKNSLYIVHHVV